MLDWNDLVRRCADGDREARGHLLEPFLGSLRAFIRIQAGAKIRAQESVSDLVQSVCREVLEDLGKFEVASEAAFRRWLFTTAERKLVDRVRRYGAEKRGGGRTKQIAESWSNPDPAVLECYARFVGPIQHAIAAETQARIEHALQQLSEDDRRVIVLTRIQDLPHAEAAKQLGRNVVATRVMLFRALARLAKKLDLETK